MNMIFFGFISVVISASMIITNIQVERIDNKEDTVFNIIKGASELGYLANDYLIYRESQQLERWRNRFVSFYNDISSLQIENEEQKVLVNILEADSQRLKFVFESSVSAIGNSSPDSEGTIDRSSFQLSSSRIAVQSQGLISDASQLSQLLIKQLDYYHKINIIVSFVLGAILLIFFIVSFLMIQRRILKSIETLQNATVIVGSGKLDYKFDDLKNDEIGDLSRAFNQMTISLKEVTASKADLEKEIVVRRQIEEALKVNERKYHDLFSSMSEGFGLHEIIFDAEGKPCDYRFIEVNDAFEMLTGISREEIIGKTVKEVMPNTDYYWIETYGKVVLTGEPNHFENYSTPLKKWFETYTYNTGKNQFAVLFRDITERRKEEKNRIEKIRKVILKKEREKIAAELHDSVTQIIFTSSLLAESILKTWEKDPEKVLKNLKMIIDLNSSAFSELRILLYELMPEKISQENLKNLIKRLVDAAGRQSNIKIDMTVKGNYDFNYKIKHQVYRIAQESINNILKHSKANYVKIDLALYPDDLKLNITDNGKGFDINNNDIKKRFGLKLMKDRAKTAGAFLDITSTPGAGTRIALIYPKNKRKQLSLS